MGRSAVDGARLLVLGAGAMRERAFSVWARMGLHVTLVDGFSRHRYEGLVDTCLVMEARDDSAIDWVALGAVAAGCDGVTSLSDETLATAASLAEQCGVPGPSVGAAALAKSKPGQRARYAELGLRVPRNRRATGVDDLGSFVEARAARAVVKPVGSAAGHGVQLVGPDSSEEALDQAWGQALAASPVGEVLVEDYLAGAEISLEAIVHGGEVAELSVTEKETVGAPCFLERQHVVGAAQVGPHHRRAVRDLVSAFDVHDGPVHAEFKVGEDGELTLVEYATRPGGGWIPDITAATGWDIYRDQAYVALSAGVGGREPTDTVAGARFLYADGTVSGFAEPLAVRAAFGSVDRVQMMVPEGSALRRPVANWTRAAAVSASGVVPSGVIDDLRGAVSMVARLAGVEERWT